MTVRRHRRIAAYGLLHDLAGRALLVRGRGPAWTLPGGTVEHGESPQATVVRLMSAQAGMHTAVQEIRAATSDLVQRPGGVLVHHDRLLFVVAAIGPPAQPVPTTLPDGARWFSPDELAAQRVSAYTADVLGVDLPRGDRNPALVTDPDEGWAAERGLAFDISGPVPRVQRFSTYALATDPDGRVLLARVAPDYPGAGRWHLPGGGTDFGEAPAAALLREVTEETAQHGRVGDLLAVSHWHNPAALGREGHPIDWHTVRVVYEVAVDHPGEPRVTEAAGGSTAEAAWLLQGDLDNAPLTDLAALFLRDRGVEPVKERFRPEE